MAFGSLQVGGVATGRLSTIVTNIQVPKYQCPLAVQVSHGSCSSPFSDIVTLGSGFNGPSGTTFATADAFGTDVAVLGMRPDGVGQLVAIGATFADSNNGAIHLATATPDWAWIDGAILDAASTMEPCPVLNGIFAELVDPQLGAKLGPAGDLDGDGFPDLIIGDPRAGGGGTSRGRIIIVMLHGTGQCKSATEIHDGQGLPANTFSNEDRFSTGASFIGKVDADDVQDLVVGVRERNSGSGAAIVMLTNTSATVKSHTMIESPLPGPLVIVADSYFGSNVAPMGLWDDDGVPDIAVSAQTANTLEGAVYIITLNEDGTAKTAVVIDAVSPGSKLAG